MTHENALQLWDLRIGVGIGIAAVTDIAIGSELKQGARPVNTSSSNSDCDCDPDSDPDPENH